MKRVTEPAPMVQPDVATPEDLDEDQVQYMGWLRRRHYLRVTQRHQLMLLEVGALPPRELARRLDRGDPITKRLPVGGVLSALVGPRAARGWLRSQLPMVPPRRPVGQLWPSQRHAVLGLDQVRT